MDEFPQGTNAVVAVISYTGEGLGEGEWAGGLVQMHKNGHLNTSISCISARPHHTQVMTWRTP